MGYLSVLIAGLLLACVQGAPSDCRKTYQKLLQNVVTLKEECSGAAFRDCCQAKELVPRAGSGSYEVADVCDATTNFGSSELFASCDMDTDGGKWLVIQKRFNGSVDFYRNWTDYVYGFGKLEGEFWYGLEKIHCLTTRDDVELRIEIGNGTTPFIVWTYQTFRVAGAETNYRLTIGEGQGEGGTDDSMAFHNGRAFSTPDRDNDADSGNCATTYGGGWWYNACYRANLNGRYNHSSDLWQTITWYDGSIYKHLLTNIAMKIRPKKCSVKSTTCN